MEVQNSGGDPAPVFLNIYDLTSTNDYLYGFGFGVFHSGIEVHGMEYGFGAHEFPTSGVFEVELKGCPGFVYRRSVCLSTTDMSQAEFHSFIENLAGKYHSDSYHLISKNCNHFTDDVSKNLTGKPILGWVNWLARVGSFFNCPLPEAIQVITVTHAPTRHSFSDDNMDSISPSIVRDIKEDEPNQHLLPIGPEPSIDLHPIDLLPKLAKDLP